MQQYALLSCLLSSPSLPNLHCCSPNRSSAPYSLHHKNNNHHQQQRDLLKVHGIAMHPSLLLLGVHWRLCWPASLSSALNLVHLHWGTVEAFLLWAWNLNRQGNFYGPRAELSTASTNVIRSAMSRLGGLGSQNELLIFLGFMTPPENDRTTWPDRILIVNVGVGSVQSPVV